MNKSTYIPEKWDQEADLIAVGSSSGGLTAAITGHNLGLSTIVIEKAEGLGGGTAVGGGELWIPYNHHMLELGLSDSKAEGLQFINNTSHGRGDEKMAEAYVETAPKMLLYMEEHTPLKMMVAQADRPDWYSDIPGGKCGGRDVSADPEGQAEFLAEKAKQFPLLNKVMKSPTKRLLRTRETEQIPADMFTRGRALIGALALGCLERGINIMTNTRARKLIVQEEKVIGVQTEYKGRDFFIKANKAVLLATGGFEWNDELNRRYMPGPIPHPTTPPSLTGDGHIMGMEIGAAVANMDMSICLPVVLLPDKEFFEGKPLYQSVTGNLGRPGDMVVNRYGKRCFDEPFFPDVVDAFRAFDTITSESANVPMYWIMDQNFRNKYAVGPLQTGTKMADWLCRADSIKELAQQLGLPSDNLEETVKRFNKFAREGYDPDFQRGERSFDRWLGDSNIKPNPCLAPLEIPPYYGVEIHLGTVGHRGGLVINPNAQVMNIRGKVIPGLYATSNTTAQLSVGVGYSSGVANGLSMVFGYIAASYLARGKI